MDPLVTDYYMQTAVQIIRDRRVHGQVYPRLRQLFQNCLDIIRKGGSGYDI